MKVHSALLYTLATALFAFAVSGCRSQEQWQAALYSGQLSYTDIGGNWSLNKQGDRHGDVQEYGITYTIQPGMWWIMNMQAEMNARRMTEAAYAQRAAPGEPKKEEAKCPSGK